VIPARPLTGFLSSAKATVVNHVLKQPGMEATAVVVNEFGWIGLDHLLIDRSSEHVALLNIGCPCGAVCHDVVDVSTSLLVSIRLGFYACAVPCVAVSGTLFIFCLPIDVPTSDVQSGTEGAAYLLRLHLSCPVDRDGFQAPFDNTQKIRESLARRLRPLS
jgi:hypothetical protein